MTALKNIKKLNKGFTLIELLVVIGILAILLAITLIAINPARQFQQANNTQRSSDVNSILNAIGQYAAENAGKLPGDNADPTLNEITTTVQTISSAGADICGVLVPNFIAQLPADPSLGDAIANSCPAGYNTGYTVVKDGTNNRITITAPSTEPATAADITATR